MEVGRPLHDNLCITCIMKVDLSHRGELRGRLGDGSLRGRRIHHITANKHRCQDKQGQAIYPRSPLADRKWVSSEAGSGRAVGITTRLLPALSPSPDRYFMSIIIRGRGGGGGGGFGGHRIRVLNTGRRGQRKDLGVRFVERQNCSEGHLLQRLGLHSRSRSKSVCSLKVK